MRVLQSLYDAGGGVAPQLAVTRALVERGHEVRVLAHETLRAAVEQRGASFDEFVGEVEGFARFATFRDPDGNPVQIIEYHG